MARDVEFVFKEVVYRCDYHVDVSELPFCIFIILYDSELISAFGDNIVIKTDFKTNLDVVRDSWEVMQLKEVIFDAIKSTPQFIAAALKVKVYAGYNGF